MTIESSKKLRKHADFEATLVGITAMRSAPDASAISHLLDDASNCDLNLRSSPHDPRLAILVLRSSSCDPRPKSLFELGLKASFNYRPGEKILQGQRRILDSRQDHAAVNPLFFVGESKVSIQQLKIVHQLV